MRKLTLLAAALAVTIGAASAMACDHDKASSASASKSSSGSCCSSSSNTSASLTSSDGGSCSGMKSASAGSCSAHKMSNASASEMPAECKKGDCADAVFQVASIHGDCCVDGVTTALKSVKGVQYVNVDVKTKKAYVCTRGAKLDQKAAIKSLKDAGFANATYLGVDKKHMMKANEKTSATSKV